MGMDEKQKKLAEELLFSGVKKPSFAKWLYFGMVDGEKIFPFPELKDEEKKKVEKAINEFSHFAKQAIDPVAIDREAKIPDAVIQGLAKQGILGFTVAETNGGKGMSYQAFCKLMERVAAVCNSTALFINVHQSIGLRALELFGTKGQKEKWLIPLAKGDKLAAFSLTEPNAGSDAAGIETKAVYDPIKKVYRLNGVKQWTSNGSVADVLTVMAKGEDGKISAFLVTPTMKGFRIRDKSLEKTGMRGTWTANLAFDEMEVPEENLLGDKGAGLKVCLTVLDYGRTTFGAMCLGSAKWLFNEALQHAKTRIQFGRALIAFPLVQKKLVYMAGMIYAMEAATYLTAGLLDQGQHDIMIESAILKVFNSEAHWQIIYDTMQIFGGRSFFTDRPFERIMRDSRLNMIGEGSNEVLKAFIGVVGMRDVGLQLKSGLESGKGMLHLFQSIIRRLKLKVPPVRSLEKEGKELAKAARRTGFKIIQLLAKYKEEVVEEQLELERISTAITSLYVGSAVLSLLESELARGDHSREKEAKWVFHHLMEEHQKALDVLFSSHDREIKKITDAWVNP